MKVAMEIDPEAEEYYNIEVKADKKKKTKVILPNTGLESFGGGQEKLVLPPIMKRAEGQLNFFNPPEEMPD